LVLALTLSLALGQAPDASLDFAKALSDEGDEYRAIGEYKRFLFLHPDDPRAPDAKMAIGRSYLRGGQADAAAEYYARLAASDASLRTEASLQLGYAHYLSGHYAEALPELTGWLQAHSQVAGPPVWRARYVLSWTELSMGKFQESSEMLAALPEFPGQPTLVRDVAALQSLPHRSPWVAGALAIVPGAGHVYLGQPLIGLAALLWNGLFGFALYDAIHHQMVGLSLVVGVFESLWYFGNIFGAVSGAHKFNRDVELNALEQLRATHDDHPEAWPPSR
jgi:tetratricopeptide (TPR) repeat protein